MCRVADEFRCVCATANGELASPNAWRQRYPFFLPPQGFCFFWNFHCLADVGHMATTTGLLMLRGE
eukprot:1157681-Pelagomonas_calceolata.AAC.5